MPRSWSVADRGRGVQPGLKPLLPAALQARVFDHVQTRSVRELVGLFAHCQLFVGNDTGPRHMAQALEIPLLTIVAPGSDKIIANPVNHPRYQTIDIFDARGLSAARPRRRTSSMKPCSA